MAFHHFVNSTLKCLTIAKSCQDPNEEWMNNKPMSLWVFPGQKLQFSLLCSISISESFKFYETLGTAKNFSTISVYRVRRKKNCFWGNFDKIPGFHESMKGLEDWNLYTKQLKQLALYKKQQTKNRYKIKAIKTINFKHRTR